MALQLGSNVGITTAETDLGVQFPSKVSVTWEDQQNINKFSNLYSRLGDVEQQLKEQKVSTSSRVNVKLLLALQLQLELVLACCVERVHQGCITTFQGPLPASPSVHVAAVSAC
jgi:hypothetical protein